MDDILDSIMRASIDKLGLSNDIRVIRTRTDNRIWIRDDRVVTGARWVIAEPSDNAVILKNGSKVRRIELFDPNSITNLANALNDSLIDTRYFYDD